MNLELGSDYRYQYRDLPEIKGDDDVSIYIEKASEMYPVCKVKPQRTPLQNFDNPIAQRNWEMEEIRRCIKGHGGLTGKMYFYYNYCFIKNVEKGIIRPEFRVADAMWFHVLEACGPNQYLEGFGPICLKRRRSGFSWKEACDMLHDALFSIGANIGMTSKSERDAKRLFGWVQFIYEKLPGFMKAPMSSQSKEHITFARKVKNEHGNRELKGHQSTMYSAAPTDNCFEGDMLTKMVVDEVGKITNVLTIWAMSKDCLMQETRRLGIPVLFGTAGEQDGNGAGQREFWMKSKSYSLVKFFFPGWAGMFIDDNGNDDIEKAVQWIVDKRKEKLESGATDYWDFVQQYPLTPREALLMKDGAGIGNVKKIKEQEYELEQNPVRVVEGKFRWGLQGEPEVVFEPNTIHDKSGQCRVYEHPKGELETVAGCLPAGEKVLTDSGLKDIEKITLKDKLISKDGDYVDIKELQQYNVKDSLHELSVSNTLRTTKFTGEHPLYVSDNKKGYNGAKKRGSGSKYSYQKFDFDFKEVRDIKEGQWIKYPNIYKKEKDIDLSSLWDNNGVKKGVVIDNPLYNEDFWWFVGIWLGDGSNHKGQFYISCNISEEENIRYLCDIIERLFNRSPSLDKKKGNCVDVRFNSKQLSDFFLNTFGKGAATKVIPEWVKFLPLKYKLNLIGGYIDSDGCVSKDKRRDNYNVEIVSINMEMMESLQDILFSIGIISGVSKLREAKQSSIEGRVVNQKETYRLRMGHYWLKKLISLGLNSSKTMFLPILKDVRLNKHGCQFSDNNDYIYFQIKNIKTTNIEDVVYNFHCDTSTYLCHHITSHNCDPADHDYVNKGSSDLSMYIMSKQKGSRPPRLVFSFTDRPEKVNDYYDQALMALIYYNNTKVLIENNRNGMIQYFQNNGYISLLKPEPQPKNVYNVQQSKRLGIRKTVQTTQEMERVINQYTDDYAHLIPELELLQEFQVYGQENTDRVIAFGWTLVSLEDETVTREEQQRIVNAMPKWRLRKQGGKLIRVKK